MKRRYHRTYDDSSKSIPSQVDRKLLLRLLAYLKPYRWYLVIAIIALFIAKGLEAYVPLYLGKMIQKILDSAEVSSTGKEMLFDSLVTGSFLILTLLACSYVLEGVNVLFKSWVGQKALFALRTDVYKHIQSLPISYFDRHAIGGLMTRTIHDVDQVNQLLTESVVPIVGNVILFLSILIMLFFLDWRLAVATLCLIPPVLFHTFRFRRRQRRSFNKVRAILSSINGYIQEQLMGISVIRSFGLEDREMENFEEMNQDQKTAYLETTHNYAYFTAGIDFSITAFMILMFVIVSYSSVYFEAGTYFTMSLYGLMIFRPLSDLAERYNVLQGAVAAGERIFKVMDAPCSDDTLTLRKRPPLESISLIEFDHVDFGYSPGNPLLRGVTFSVERGQTLAVVGPTGSGKTTLMNLLLRLYSGYEGQIRINGYDIRSWPKEQLRRHFSVVMQDPVLFSGTLTENIALFDPAIGIDVIKSAVDYVGLKPLVARMPLGLDTHLSERGESLSVGQRQLVSMARAVVHDRSVIILDEATANIDSHSERVIQQTLKKMLHSKTSLVVAHRLSTIKDADHILVVDEGVICEYGSHRDLIAKDGIYAQLCRLQDFSESE